MTNKDVLALLDEIRKIKSWIPNDWTRKFLEDMDFTARVAKQAHFTQKQGEKLLQIYQQATDWECRRVKPENLQV